MKSFKKASRFKTPGEIICSRLDDKIDVVGGFRTFPTLLIAENAERRSRNLSAKQVDFPG
jgi:hypothetical protein